MTFEPRQELNRIPWPNLIREALLWLLVGALGLGLGWLWVQAFQS